MDAGSAYTIYFAGKLKIRDTTVQRKMPAKAALIHRLRFFSSSPDMNRKPMASREPIMMIMAVKTLR